MAVPRQSRPKPPLPPGAERRQYERFELLAQVELRRKGEVSLLPVANISAGGMAVRLEGGELADIAIGEPVSVFLEVSDLPEPIAVTLDASVVRVNGVSSVALKWTSTDGFVELGKLIDYIARRQ
jgi:hypothetical protein